MQSIIAQVFRSYAHQRKSINRALLGIDALVGDCLYSMLNEDERDRIVRICYANTGHTVMKQAPELSDWEMDWFKNTLPRPCPVVRGDSHITDAVTHPECLRILIHSTQSGINSKVVLRA